MSIEVKIPSVGESVSSGIISRWHKRSGETVRTGDVLLTLETDKVSTEVTSEADGMIEVLIDEGREVQIGEVVAVIREDAKADAEAQPTTAASAADTTTAPEPPSKPAPAASEEPSEPSAPKNPEPEIEPKQATRDEGEIGRHGPAAARVLRQEEIDPADIVERSGPGGRITRDDLDEFLRRRAEAAAGQQTARETATTEPPPTAAESPAAPSPAPTPEPAPVPQVVPASNQLAVPSPASLSLDTREASAEAMTTRKPMSPLRKKIAQQLVNAQRQAALLTTFNECDMSAVIAIRSRMQESFQARHGIKLGFMSFFVKAVVNALQEVPSINARIDGDDIVQHHYYDIGVAVGTDRGLLVPVLRRADTKSFAALEKEMSEYAARARDGKIQIDDLRGGVFTISNGGIYGSLMSTPIVNPPQSAILGMHAIKERAVVADGEVVVRPMMYLALTYDHRIIDGKEAVTFLVRVKEAIEDPMQLIL